MAIKFNALSSVKEETPATEARTERPQAKVWINIGVTIGVPQADGTVVDTFVSIPAGIPLDTMEPMVGRGNSADYAALVQAKNWVLSQLQTAAEDIKAGEDQLVEGLEVRIRRAGVAQAPAEGENAILTALAAKFKLVA